MKTHYDLLELASTASADDIKHAFRQQIARYHPDKVQHLGAEFQAMAAERAAALTEAYRILSDAGRRAEYDRVLAGAAAAGRTSAPAAPPEAAEPVASRSVPSDDAERPPGREPFSDARARSGEVVRRAALARFRDALDRAIDGDAERRDVRGFDVAVVPKKRLFGRSGGPRLLARFVHRPVDAPAVADAWAAALKWSVPASEEVCIFLIGSGMAPARELADAIGEQRRRPARGVKVTLVPVDARDWQAHIPTDAPPLVRTLLGQLRKDR